MAVSDPKRKKKTVHKFTFPSFEFIKIYLVRDRRVYLGISAYELSFLLGKDLQFVKDVEDPLEKKRYGINDTNYLWLILSGPLSSIMPDRVTVNTYHVKITKYSNGVRVTVYRIEKAETKEGPYEFFKEIEVEDKHVELFSSLKTSTFEKVQAYIDKLLSENFFDTPQRALDIYQKCQLKFGPEFHPRNMIKVLNFYTNKKSGDPKLNKEKKNRFGRTLFVKIGVNS
jgi:hypothetical protein